MVSALCRNERNPGKHVVKTDLYRVYTKEKVYLDCTGMSCVSVLGINNTELNNRIHNSILNCPTAHSGSWTTDLSSLATAELCQHGNFYKAYWTVSSSAALEAALKISFKISQGKYFFADAFTLNGNSLMGNMLNYNYSRSKNYKQMFSDINYYNNNFVEDLRKNADKISAVIVEPWRLSNGVGKLEQASTIQEICNSHDILLIVDETITGYHRSDNFWGYQCLGLNPDMVYTGKGINNGFCPAGVLLINEKVYNRVSEFYEGEFDQWNTLCDSPVVQASVYHTLKLVSETKLFNLYEKCTNEFNEVKGNGKFVGIPCHSRLSVEQGLELGLVYKVKNNTICLSPPYNWTDNEFDEFTNKVKKLL